MTAHNRQRRSFSICSLLGLVASAESWTSLFGVRIYSLQVPPLGLQQSITREGSLHRKWPPVPLGYFCAGLVVEKL